MLGDAAALDDALAELDGAGRDRAFWSRDGRTITLTPDGPALHAPRRRGLRRVSARGRGAAFRRGLSLQERRRSRYRR